MCSFEWVVGALWKICPPFFPNLEYSVLKDIKIAMKSYKVSYPKCVSYFKKSILEKVRQGALWAQNSWKMDKFKDISTIDAAPRTNWVPEWPAGTTETCFQVDHVVLGLLETKRILNFVIFGTSWLFLRGFWHLAALKPCGWPGNLKIVILCVLPEVLISVSVRYLCQ